MSHRGEDGGDGSDVDGSGGGGLLTCCTSAGLPPPPPPPQPLLLHLLAPPARRTAVETSAGRSSDRRSDACPDVSRPGRMSVTRREKGASDQAAPPHSSRSSIPSADRSFLLSRSSSVTTSTDPGHPGNPPTRGGIARLPSSTAALSFFINSPDDQTLAPFTDSFHPLPLAFQHCANSNTRRELVVESGGKKIFLSRDRSTSSSRERERERERKGVKRYRNTRDAGSFPPRATEPNRGGGGGEGGRGGGGGGGGRAAAKVVKVQRIGRVSKQAERLSSSDDTATKRLFRETMDSRRGACSECGTPTVARPPRTRALYERETGIDRTGACACPLLRLSSSSTSSDMLPGPSSPLPLSILSSPLLSSPRGALSSELAFLPHDRPRSRPRPRPNGLD